MAAANQVARQRAFRRMAKVHPELFERLYQEERRSLGMPPEPPRRFCAAEQDDIVARYRAGESGHAIAKAYGCHYETVRKVLVKAGVPRRHRGRRAA